jgi:predicted dithiol-disulfide oxidoreductase (DUF899 family)
VPVDKDYVFDGPAGQATLLDLFEGRRQLIVQHFMFDPTWDEGCPYCSYAADSVGQLAHLHACDTTFAVISRAPIGKIEAFRRRMGWSFPWYSSLGSDFNYDFGVAFTDEQQANGAEYNFRHVDEPGPQREGMSAFAIQDGMVHHTYSTYDRGVEALMGTYQYLDLAPAGRNEDNLTETWWRRHDEHGLP